MRIFNDLTAELHNYKVAIIKARMNEYYNIVNGVVLPRWQDDNYKRFNNYVNQRIKQLEKRPDFTQIVLEGL